MFGVEIRQRAVSEGQRDGRRGQEGWPTPPHRASWSTVNTALHAKKKKKKMKGFKFMYCYHRKLKIAHRKFSFDK